jgi:fructokinase
MGHLPLPRHPRDSFAGQCPYHKDCLEGMACGPAIQARWGKPADELPADHEAWEFEAYYLARAICAMTYVLSPQRVILGGGVMHQQQLFPRIRQMVVEMLNSYIQSSAIIEHIETYIVPPGLADRAGTVGALELARRAERDRHS